MVVCSVDWAKKAVRKYRDLCQGVAVEPRPLHAVIVDDASRISEMQAVFVMEVGGASSVLLIGDPGQPGPQVTVEAAAIGMNHDWSLMHRALQCSIEPRTLHCQHRMLTAALTTPIEVKLGRMVPHPYLRRFPSLVVSGLCWLHVDAEACAHHCGGQSNRVEAEKCCDLARFIHSQHPSATIALLTPFGQQRDLLNGVVTVQQERGSDVPLELVDTVSHAHGFQADFVIVRFGQTGGACHSPAQHGGEPRQGQQVPAGRAACMHAAHTCQAGLRARWQPRRLPGRADVGPRRERMQNSEDECLIVTCCLHCTHGTTVAGSVPVQREWRRCWCGRTPVCSATGRMASRVFLHLNLMCCAR